MGGEETIWVKVTSLCFTNSKSKSNNYVKKIAAPSLNESTVFENLILEYYIGFIHKYVSLPKSCYNAKLMCGQAKFLFLF